MARLVSVNVGMPRDINWHGNTVHTGVWKTPVARRLTVRRLNIDGDGQGDLAGHGGEQRAVMVYQIESYRYWEHELGRSDFGYGQFGENFTIEGMPDSEVCVGDRYRIGTALFEVTQPRVTCYRVGIRMEEPRMPSLLVAHHRPGFYFRVLEEGEIGAGDEIFQIASGPEHVTIAEIDALLYLPGRERQSLERALRVPALSPGWKSSLQALLAQDSHAAGAGNAGLTASIEPPPAWAGFRKFQVAAVERESASVLSFSLKAADGTPLPTALPGQFLVLKLRPTADGPPILRNYSMSGRPGADAYRISVKEEANGVGSRFLHEHAGPGDVLDVSAPRGSFILRAGENPVVLAGTGIGATPLLAMLHSLADSKSTREIWWLYGARNRAEHPFAREARELIKQLPGGKSHVLYSQPEPGDRLGEDFDAPGHLTLSMIKELGVPEGADFYLCGTSRFQSEMTAGLKELGGAATHIYSEAFGPAESIRPGVTNGVERPVHAPAGAAGSGPPVSFTRSGLTVPWDSRFQSLLELAEACDVSVRWACRTGVCHTCECGLIDGAVTYQPDPLEAPATGNVLVCCSQPSSAIELDL